jgi:Flp pilus assembly protein TadG
VISVTCSTFLLRARRFASDQNAAGAIEFAFLSPIMIMLALLTVDLGLGGYSQMQVQNAAQAGAEYALYYYPYQTTNYNGSIVTAVTSATSNTGISASPSPNQFYACADHDGLEVVYKGTTCNDGQIAGTYISVYTTTTYKPLVSYVGVGNSYVLNGQATVRVQ